MVLTKDGETVTVENENTAAGFIQNGWREIAPEQAPAAVEKKPGRKRKE